MLVELPGCTYNEPSKLLRARLLLTLKLICNVQNKMFTCVNFDMQLWLVISRRFETATWILSAFYHFEPVSTIRNLYLP